jgi:hypothetical protein
MSLANQRELNSARQGQPEPSLGGPPCPYSERRPDGSFLICRLKLGHEGNHELVPPIGPVLTLTIRLVPPQPPSG